MTLPAKLKAMVVDDEVLVRLSAVDMLEDAGFAVVGDEGSAEAALGWLAQFEDTIDLLFTDLTLPGMDGKTFAEEVRRLRPGTAVVIVTGHAGMGVRLHDDGLYELGKPFTPTHIAELVRRLTAREPS